MSGSLGPEGPAVNKKGTCTRIMYAGANPHTVEQTWVPWGGRLRLFTTLIDNRARGKVGKKTTFPSEANEVALSKLAREKAEEIMVGKRSAAEKDGTPRAGGSSRVFADSAMSCPVIAAIRASQPQSTMTRTATNSSTRTSAKPSADPQVRCHTASCVKAARVHDYSSPAPACSLLNCT